MQGVWVSAVLWVNWVMGLIKDHMLLLRYLKPSSGDFTMQELLGTWGYYNQTGNLTAECAEVRGGEING